MKHRVSIQEIKSVFKSKALRANEVQVQVKASLILCNCHLGSGFLLMAGRWYEEV
jgi:hypothetical protein